MKNEFQEKLTELLKKNDKTLWENNKILNSLVKFLGFRVKLRIKLIQVRNFIDFLLGK